jgi:excisionase family DNA binding protein
MATLERLLYDRNSAAEVLSLSLRTIDYALSRGEFETRMVGRKRLITARSLKRWANTNHYGSVRGPKNDNVDQDQDKAA